MRGLAPVGFESPAGATLDPTFEWRELPALTYATFRHEGIDNDLGAG
jgi:predicted transcriptional regulator YdeE